MLQDKRTKWAGVALVVFILSYFFVSMIFDGQEERKSTKTHRPPKHPNKAPNKPISTPETTTTAQTAPTEEEVEDLFPDGEDDTEGEYKIETTQQPGTKPQNPLEDDEEEVGSESPNEATTAEAEAKLAAEEADEEEEEEEKQTAQDSSNQDDSAADPKGYDDDEDALDDAQALQDDPTSSVSSTNDAEKENDVIAGIDQEPTPGTEGVPEPRYEADSSSGDSEPKQEIISEETVDDYDDDATLGRLTSKHEDPKVTTEVETSVANNFPPLFNTTQEGKKWAKAMRTGAPFPPSLPSPPEEFPREGFMTDQEEANIAWQAEQRVSQLLDDLIMNKTRANAPHFCEIPDPEYYPCPTELSPIGVPPLDTIGSRFCIYYYGALTPKSVAGADTSSGVFAWPLPLPDRTLIGRLSFKKLNSSQSYGKLAREWGRHQGIIQLRLEQNEIPYVIGVADAIIQDERIADCEFVYSLNAHPSTHYCSARGPTNPVPSAKNLSTNFEEVFLLEQPRQGSGWQAIVETLARIAPFVEEIKNSKMSILTSLAGHMYKQYWDWLGISQDRLYPMTPGTRYFAKKAYIPNFNSCGGNSLIALRAMRKYLLPRLAELASIAPNDTRVQHLASHLRATQSPQRTILFVRTLNNKLPLFSPSESNQFVKGLQENFRPLGYNVQVFTLSEMPDAIQVLMFYQARFIIFSHDDALSSLLGARPDVLLIQVVGKEVDLRYKALGFKLGMDHALVVGREAGGFLTPDWQMVMKLIKREILLETAEKTLEETDS